MMGVSRKVLYGKVLSQQPNIATTSDVKVYLPGIANGKNISLPISDDVLSKHTLLIGCTGCGKSNVFYHYISQLKRQMKPNDVMIIFDAKGDFYNKFYSEGDAVIANSKKYRHITSRWNIYKEIVADGWEDLDIVNNTNEICKSLFAEVLEKNNSQPFFPSAACDLLAAILIAYIRMGTGDTSFKRKFFNNKSLKKYLEMATVSKLSTLFDGFADLMPVLAYLGDGTSEQGLGVLAEMQNVIRPILTGAFADDGLFSVREFVRRKNAKTLFVEYDLSLGNVLLPVYRLLFDLALKEAMGREKSDGNVYLICDEFKLLPHLQHIEDGVNFGRSMGVKIVAGIQSIEQLYEIYGNSRGKNIAAGFLSVYAFKMNDESSTQYISGLYGKNLVLEQREAIGNDWVEEKREGRTVESWDLNSLQVGDAVIGLPFSDPFKFHFAKYED